MKKIATLLFALVISAPLFASHLLGLEMYYDHVSGNTYDIYLKLHHDNVLMSPLSPVTLNVTGHPTISVITALPVDSFLFPMCGATKRIELYKATVNLGPIPAYGIEISYLSYAERPNYAKNMASNNSDNIFVSTTMKPLPGSTVCSSSARYLEHSYIVGDPVALNTYNSVAEDPDAADSIYATFSPALLSSNVSAVYKTGYSAMSPFGTSASISSVDPQSGLMQVQGVNTGVYSIATTVESYTNGMLTSTMKRELKMLIINSIDSIPTLSLTNITTGGTVNSAANVYSFEIDENDTIDFDVLGLSANTVVTVSGFGSHLNGSNGTCLGNGCATLTPSGSSFSGNSFASAHFNFIATPTMFAPGESKIYHNYLLQVSDTSTCGAINTDNIAVNIQINKNQSIYSQNAFSICTGGSIQAQITGDTTNISWSPTTGVSQPTSASTLLSPANSTLYTVTNNNDSSQITVLVTVDSLSAPTLIQGSTHAIIPNFANYDLVVWYYNGVGIAQNTDSVAMLYSGDYFAYVEKGACSAFSDTITLTLKNQIPINDINSGSTALVQGDGKYSFDFKMLGHSNMLSDLYLILPDFKNNKTNTPPVIEIRNNQNQIVISDTAVLMDGNGWGVQGINVSLNANEVYQLEIKFDAGDIALFKPNSFAFTEPTNNVEVISASYKSNGITNTDAFPYVVFGVQNGIGIAENEISAAVYPNPFTENITIALPGEFTVEFADAIGRSVFSASGENQMHISSVNWASGVYFYKIEQNGKVKTGKLIK